MFNLKQQRLLTYHLISFWRQITSLLFICCSHFLFAPFIVICGWNPLGIYFVFSFGRGFLFVFISADWLDYGICLTENWQNFVAIFEQNILFWTFAVFEFFQNKYRVGRREIKLFLIMSNLELCIYLFIRINSMNFKSGYWQIGILFKRLAISFEVRMTLIVYNMRTSFFKETIFGFENAALFTIKDNAANCGYINKIKHKMESQTEFDSHIYTFGFHLK